MHSMPVDEYMHRCGKTFWPRSRAEDEIIMKKYESKRKRRIRSVEKQKEEEKSFRNSHQEGE